MFSSFMDSECNFSEKCFSSAKLDLAYCYVQIEVFSVFSLTNLVNFSTKIVY